MDIKISSGFGRLGINYVWADINIRQSSPKSNISYTGSGLRIETENTKAKIDAQECWADIGLKQPMRFAIDNYKNSKNKAISNIGKIAAEGNRLMRIEKGDVSIVPKENYDFPSINVILMPKQPPEIYWSDPVLKIDYDNIETEINWNVQNRASVSASRHEVDIYLLKKPYIDIEYVGKAVDERV